jgi:hypothetical protein
MKASQKGWSTMNSPEPMPRVEIHAPKGHIGAAAGIGDTLLSSDQIASLQQTITTLISGFRPPTATQAGAHPDPASPVRFESLEVELGFKLELGAGSIVKLVFDAGSEASITAKVTWSRPK